LCCLLLIGVVSCQSITTFVGITAGTCPVLTRHDILPTNVFSYPYDGSCNNYVSSTSFTLTCTQSATMTNMQYTKYNSTGCSGVAFETLAVNAAIAPGICHRAVHNLTVGVPNTVYAQVLCAADPVQYNIARTAPSIIAVCVLASLIGWACFGYWMYYYITAAQQEVKLGHTTNYNGGLAATDGTY